MIQRKIFKEISLNCSVCGKLVHKITADRMVLCDVYTTEPYTLKCKECYYDER